jgi:hypothetical protein
LITGGERPGVGAVGDGEEPEGGEVEVAMVLRRQKAPVEVATLADGNRCSVFRHHLHPGGRIYLKIKVGVVIWAKVWPIQLKCLVTQCLKLAKRASLTLLSRPSSRTSTPGWETFVS